MVVELRCGISAAFRRLFLSLNFFDVDSEANELSHYEKSFESHTYCLIDTPSHFQHSSLTTPYDQCERRTQALQAILNLFPNPIQSNPKNGKHQPRRRPLAPHSPRSTRNPAVPAERGAKDQYPELYVCSQSSPAQPPPSPPFLSTGR